MTTATCSCGQVIEYTEIVDETYMFHGKPVGSPGHGGEEPSCQECVDEFVAANF